MPQRKCSKEIYRKTKINKRITIPLAKETYTSLVNDAIAFRQVIDELRRFGVPFWGLTCVSGRNDQYWYRLLTQLGRYDMVTTTIKAAEALPQHLLADEKHAHYHGQRVYIATTVGDDCGLGQPFRRLPTRRI